MQSTLQADAAADLIRRGFSHQHLGKIASLLTAGAALPFYNEPALAQLSMVKNMPADAVKINANENPMGPCPEAAEAIHNVVKKGGRYMYEETYDGRNAGEQEGVKFGYKPEESYVEVFRRVRARRCIRPCSLSAPKTGRL